MRRTEAILFTLPKKFFDGYGMDRFENDMRRANIEDDFQWNRACRSLPRNEPLYVYFVYGGFVQYRMDFSHFERNQTKHFPATGGGIRTFSKKHWVIMRGPSVKAPYPIPMRGFQGFRYTEFIF